MKLFRKTRERWTLKLMQFQQEIIHGVVKQLVWKVFSDVSLEKLKRIVEAAEKNRIEKGQTDYESLAEIYLKDVNS